MNKELATLQNEGAFDLQEVMEWEVARRRWPNAIIVGGRVVRAEKMAGLNLPLAEKVYKGRLAAQGNHRPHASGATIHDDDVARAAPIGLEEARTPMRYALGEKGPAPLRGDARGAYVKGPLKGRTALMGPDKSVRLAHWGRFRDPCSAENKLLPRQDSRGSLGLFAMRCARADWLAS